MALLNGIKIDNVVYDVRIKYQTLTRTFELIEGRNAGTTLTYKRKRDLQGTGYIIEFQVEPSPSNRAAYDAFFNKISEPVDSHELTLPFYLYGTTNKFTGYITGGTDTFEGFRNGVPLWKGLKVKVQYFEPIRTEV